MTPEPAMPVVATPGPVTTGQVTDPATQGVESATPGLRTEPGSAQPVVEALLDHLVYAVPDLAAAVDDVERRTGLRPVPGGRHLGLGTRNFLVGIGPSAYLEIIGLDVEHPPSPGAVVPFGVDRIDGPRLLTWAVHPVDIDAAVAAFAAVGADLGAPQPMSRRTPSAGVLRWRLATTMPLPTAAWSHSSSTGGRPPTRLRPRTCHWRR